MSERIWKTGTDLFGSLHVYDEGGDRLTNDRMSSVEDWPEIAALIASAPDLLEACRAFVEGRPTEEPPKHAAIAHRNWQLFEQARAAIEKATSHD